jgi:hypothetical protein
MHEGFLTMFLLLVSGSVFSQAQTQTGLYLTIPCDKNTPKHSYVPKGKRSVCITELPIVSSQGFASIGPLNQNGADVYFDITFTQEAYKKTNGVASMLNNSSFALVIEGDVFAIIAFKEMRNKIVQRFKGNIIDYGAMESGHAKLKGIIESSTTE